MIHNNQPRLHTAENLLTMFKLQLVMFQALGVDCFGSTKSHFLADVEISPC